MNSPWQRAIALADMNAFFASIEQLDDPALRGRPVAVTNGRRGTCIITCSYEARAWGVRTGMRLRAGRRLCPDLVQRPARPERYAEISTRIMRALTEITPLIEVFSVDEAFLDVTASQKLFGSVAAIGARIKAVIHRVSGLHASVGLSEGKLTAKWAAKRHKPDGLTLLPPEQVRAALAPRPVEEICGIARGIRTHLARYGAATCGDVARLPIGVLAGRWGDIGRRLWSVCRGHDPAPLILSAPAPKSIGHGKVTPPDTRDPRLIATYLIHMAEKVAARLRRHDYEAGRLQIGLRTRDGWLEREYRVMPTACSHTLRGLCRHFVQHCWHGEGIFQVQITAHNPQPRAGQQDWLRPAGEPHQEIDSVVDRINRRYGEFAIAPGTLLGRSDMPNVIAPAWRPDGHRATVEGYRRDEYRGRDGPAQNFPMRNARCGVSWPFPEI